MTAENVETEMQLAEYDEMFKDRYTESDAEYMKVIENALDPPPCVENWYTRPKRTFDWAR